MLAICKSGLREHVVTEVGTIARSSSAELWRNSEGRDDEYVSVPLARRNSGVPCGGVEAHANLRSRGEYRLFWLSKHWSAYESLPIFNCL